MPGLYGHIQTNVTKSIIQAMGEMLCHCDRQTPEIIFSDKYIASGRVPVNEEYRRDDVASFNGVYGWVDGEILNSQDLGNCIDEKNDPARIMAGIFSRDQLNHLKEINGFFSAVIYDSNTRQIHLVSDRFGLRQLYYYTHGLN